MYTLYGCVDGVIFLVQYCCFCSCSCRWGETVFLNCRHQRTYCSSTRWYMSMEGHGGMILTWENQRTRRKIQPSATLSDIWVLRVIIEWYWHGKNQSTLRKIDHSSSLSTKNLTCTDSATIDQRLTASMELFISVGRRTVIFIALIS
jgi:hypothetical protein